MYEGLECLWACLGLGEERYLTQEPSNPNEHCSRANDGGGRKLQHLELRVIWV